MVSSSPPSQVTAERRLGVARHSLAPAGATRHPPGQPGVRRGNPAPPGCPGTAGETRHHPPSLFRHLAGSPVGAVCHETEKWPSPNKHE